jgi:hypothetical protein
MENLHDSEDVHRASEDIKGSSRLQHYNIRLESCRHFRDIKREYMKAKVD